MLLLSPEQIKNEKKVGTEEARQRVTSLAKEETDLVLRVNLLKQDEEEYLKRKKDREAAGLVGAVTGDVESVIGVATRRTVLEAQVTALERRRVAAMKPVEIIRREAMEALSNAHAIETSNQRVEIELRDKQNDLNTREADLKRREERGARNEEERTASLDLRETGIKVGEEEVKKLIAGFATTVSEHSLKASADNEAMAIRESRVQQDQKINEVEAQRLNDRNTEQDERERGLQRRYQALAIAEKK